MNNLAEHLETIVEAESDRYDQLDCEIVEFSPKHRESLSENFLEELDAWVRRYAAGFSPIVGFANPGPFEPRTIEFGEYFGWFENGRLAAMAVERMHAGTLRVISRC